MSCEQSDRLYLSDHTIFFFWLIQANEIFSLYDED